MSDDARPFLDEARDIVGRCAGLYRKLSGASSLSGGLGELGGALHEAGSTLEKAIAQAARERSPAPADSGAASHDPPAPAALGEDEESDEPEEVQLARTLSSIRFVVEEEKLVIDRSDYAFVDKAPELIEGLGEAGRSGDKAARIFVDCVRFMDSIEREYGLSGGGSLARTLGSLRSVLAEHLEETHDIRFVPDPRIEDSETPESLAGLVKNHKGAKPVKFPSPTPAGEVIGLLKRGVETPSGAEPPEVLVSLGDSSDAFELVQKLSFALTRPLDQPPNQRQAKARAFRQIRRKYLPELAGAAADSDGDSPADREATVLRYVVNLLVPLNGDGSLGPAIERLVAELKERGISQIPARLGVPFDESFGTGRFERRTIRSDKPLGQVAAVLRMGFVNRDGVPVQKAVIGVSGGSDFRP